MSWSEWLDFDKAGVEKVPEQSGVFVTHASMKIHYIGGSANMRRTLEELLNDTCAKNAKRFHYMTIASFEEEKEKLLKDYADKHQGKLPLCMEK